MKKTIVYACAIIVLGFASCKGGDKVNSLDQNNKEGIKEETSKQEDKVKGDGKVAVKVIEDENSLVNKVIILADPYEFSEQIAGPVTIVDVRTPEEYSNGKISNAQNINFLGDDFEDKISALDKTQPIFIYCQSGNRSGKAALKMKSLGFKKIYDLEGGYSKWKELGL